jgi:hypothetical protein
MIIVLTEKKTGLPFTVEAGLILCSRTVMEEPSKKREGRGIVHDEPTEPSAVTHVITGITAQGQLQSFVVIETPLEIGRRINAALKCDIPPDVLGYPLG